MSFAKREVICSHDRNNLVSCENWIFLSKYAANIDGDGVLIYLSGFLSFQTLESENHPCMHNCIIGLGNYANEVLAGSCDYFVSNCL